MAKRKPSQADEALKEVEQRTVARRSNAPQLIDMGTGGVGAQRARKRAKEAEAEVRKVKRGTVSKTGGRNKKGK